MILHSVRIKFLDMDILVEFVVEWNEVYECAVADTGLSSGVYGPT